MGNADTGVSDTRWADVGSALGTTLPNANRGNSNKAATAPNRRFSIVFAGIGDLIII